MLRANHLTKSDLQIDGAHTIDGEFAAALEISVEFERLEANHFGLRLRTADTIAVEVKCDWDGVHVADTSGTAFAPFRMTDNQGSVKIRLFLDRSVAEVFVNDTGCLTRVGYWPLEDLQIELFCDTKAAARSLDIWALKSVW
jgi:hypothetical protein